MKEMNRLLTLVISGLMTAVAAGASAQDWPRWRGANRDAKAAQFKAPKTWPSELKLKWKVGVGSGDASPALVGDKLYVFARDGGDEVTRCLDAGSGKELWQDKNPAESFNGPDAALHSGPRSTPTVTGGKVVTLGIYGIVTCLDAANGKVLWRKNDFPGAWPRFHAAMSPLVVNGLCVAQLGKESAGAIVGYDLASGEQKWKWDLEGPGYASPVLFTAGGKKMIITQTAKSVVGIDPADGKCLWQTAFAPQGMAYNAATPIIAGDTLIYCGQGRGTRAVKIEKTADGFAAKELWSNPDNAVQFNTPVLKNGLLFGLSQRGNFFCINTENGKTAWTDPTGGRGAFGSIVDAGPVLVALNAKNQFTVIEPTEKQYTEIASLKLGDKPSYAYPILAGSRLFIKDLDSVVLWTID